MDFNKIFNELLNLQTYKSLQKHYLILWFYFFIVFITATIGHILDKQNGFINGMVIGFIISVILSTGSAISIPL